MGFGTASHVKELLPGDLSRQVHGRLPIVVGGVQQVGGLVQGIQQRPGQQLALHLVGVRHRQMQRCRGDPRSWGVRAFFEIFHFHI